MFQNFFHLFFAHLNFEVNQASAWNFPKALAKIEIVDKFAGGTVVSSIVMMSESPCLSINLKSSCAMV